MGSEAASNCIEREPLKGVIFEETIATLPVASAIVASTTDTGEITPPSEAVAEDEGCRFKRVCLFYCPETEELAHRIAAQSDSIQLKCVNWR